MRPDDRGSVSAELVLSVPALMLLILLIAQFAIWEHAEHVAQSAASQALAAARVLGGTDTTGQTEADNVVSQLDSGALRNVRATVTRGPEQSTVEIQGDASSVIPFVHLPVQARAVGPNEQFLNG